MTATLNLVDMDPADRPKASGVDNRVPIVGLTRDALIEALQEIGVPQKQCKMRANQLWYWLYVRGARGFDEMTLSLIHI